MRTGGRAKYIGNCFLCHIDHSDRWYRKAIKEGVICRSCYGKERLKNPEIRSKRIHERKTWSINFPYKEAIKIAKAKKIKFTLTESEFNEKIKNGCHYCGGKLNYSGIKLDRINNELFYTNESTVACCKICNVAKNNRTYGEFISWLKLLNERLI
jgi:hypothetical protein